MASKASKVSPFPFLLLSVLLIAVDQATKIWALESLVPFSSRPFIGEVLKFYLVWNDSAAFSLSLGATWIFTIISSVAALVIIWLLLRTASKSWMVTLSVLLGGVVGNLADRLFREPGFPIGKVVDFLQLPFNFPVFNVADICITFSMTAVVVLVMRGVKLGK
jgi:signal peptidase II